MPLLIIPSFANVDLFIRREAARATLVKPSDKHYEASIDDLINVMISVLARFDYFALVKMTIKSMNRLFRPVIPTCIHPFLAIRVLPGAINLRDNRFREIIRVLNMDPIT